MPWRVDGVRIYKVKRKGKSKRKTYAKKSTAKAALAKRGFRTSKRRKGGRRRRSGGGIASFFK